jgi:hypothetical protein
LEKDDVSCRRRRAGLFVPDKKPGGSHGQDDEVGKVGVMEKTVPHAEPDIRHVDDCARKFSRSRNRISSKLLGKAA